MRVSAQLIYLGPLQQFLVFTPYFLNQLKSHCPRLLFYFCHVVFETKFKFYKKKVICVYYSPHHHHHFHCHCDHLSMVVSFFLHKNMEREKKNLIIRIYGECQVFSKCIIAVSFNLQLLIFLFSMR